MLQRSDRLQKLTKLERFACWHRLSSSSEDLGPESPTRMEIEHLPTPETWKVEFLKVEKSEFRSQMVTATAQSMSASKVL